MIGLDDDLAVVVSQRYSPRTPRVGFCTTCTAGGCGPVRALPYRPSGTWPGTASRSSRGRRWPAEPVPTVRPRQADRPALRTAPRRSASSAGSSSLPAPSQPIELPGPRRASGLPLVVPLAQGLAVGDVGRSATAVRVDMVGLERLGLPTPTEQPGVALTPVTCPLEEVGLVGPREGAARVPPRPSVDDRAAELNHLAERDHHQEADQPRGRERTSARTFWSTSPTRSPGSASAISGSARSVPMPISTGGAGRD